MSQPDFRAFRRHILALYEAKDLRQAFDTLEQNYPSYPDHAHLIAYWRLCSHAVLGKSAEALQIAQDALNGGDWFPPDWLDRDPDLDSLRSLPAFQAIAETCSQRLAAAQRAAIPEMMLARPDVLSTPQPLLVVLHGNSSNAAATLQEWDSLTQSGWLVAIPQSSQIVGPDAYVWDNAEKALSEVRGHLEALRGEYPIAEESTVLGGFSLGGGLAAAFALRRAIPAHRFVVLEPYLRGPLLDEESATVADASLPQLRGYIFAGEKDALGMQMASAIADAARARGASCEVEVLPGLEHAYPSDFVSYAARGLAHVMASRR